MDYKSGPHEKSSGLQGYVEASYTQLLQILGPHEAESDGYKVSTEWQLVGDDGSEVSVYDYKETNLYGRALPTVERFRSRPRYDWHVGASSMAAANRFIGWLENKLMEQAAGCELTHHA
mgnify:CR=1 FL=1